MADDLVARELAKRLLQQVQGLNGAVSTALTIISNGTFGYAADVTEVESRDMSQLRGFFLKEDALGTPGSFEKNVAAAGQYGVDWVQDAGAVKYIRIG